MLTTKKAEHVKKNAKAAPSWDRVQHVLVCTEEGCSRPENQSMWKKFTKAEPSRDRVHLVFIRTEK